MAWIILTKDAVLARLEPQLVTAVKNAATGNGQADPLDDIIAQVVREVRGFVRGCANNKVGSDDTIPDELTLCALARIRFEICSHLTANSLLTEARKVANDNALALLKQVAACSFAIVNPPEGDEGPQVAAPDGVWGGQPKLNF